MHLASDKVSTMGYNTQNVDEQNHNTLVEMKEDYKLVFKIR